MEKKLNVFKIFNLVMDFVVRDELEREKEKNQILQRIQFGKQYFWIILSLGYLRGFAKYAAIILTLL